MQLANKTNKLLESDDEFSESNRVFEEEFIKPIPNNPSHNVNHYCIIIDYNKDQQMILKCNALATRRVHKLAGA